ncbi:MAG: GAF domain-containing protein [Thermoanaerobaculia bacterium]
MLRLLVTKVRAYGAILWEESDPGEGGEGKETSLYVLSQWFPTSQCVIHNLPLDSLTGDAIASGRPVNVPDWRQYPRTFRSHPFLDEHGIGSLCSIPLLYADGKRGALNFYRQAVDRFTPSEQQLLEKAARLLPGLYQALVHRFGFDLLGQAAKVLLGAAVAEATAAPAAQSAAIGCLEEFCLLLAQAFGALEVSLVLENDWEHPGRFPVVAATWERCKAWPAFERGKGQGVTGWVIDNDESQRIFNLASLTGKTTRRGRRPPRPLKRLLEQLVVAAQETLKEDLDPTIPALSCIVSPVRGGGRVLGALRCSILRRDPFLFARRELVLLELLASQVGSFWLNAMKHAESLRENESWKSLVESVGSLNHFVYSELKGARADEHSVFERALKVVGSAISGAEILDIRLIDPTGQFLYFFHTAGEAWTQGDPDLVARRKDRKFPLGPGKPQSAGAYAVQHRDVYVMEDVTRDPYYNEIFPNTRRMIIAPIRVEDEIYGVLDIRGTGPRPFHRDAKLMADLLGRQLGLYHYLGTSLTQLRKAESKLSASVDVLKLRRKKEAQTFEDFAHQLKGSLHMAHWRARAALDEDPLSPRHKRGLRAIRGQCGKARRATHSMAFFADLVAEREPEVRLQRLETGNLVRMLIEAADDQQSLLDPDLNLRFDIVRDSFGVLGTVAVNADIGLLEQAVGNLLDNAAKYSQPRTAVVVYGGRTGSDRFHISVQNKGLPIRPSEVSRLKERGFRSEEAQLVTGEGSGIGLWIVDHIMRAQGGELIVQPTAPSGLNEVKLVLPGK